MALQTAVVMLLVAASALVAYSYRKPIPAIACQFDDQHHHNPYMVLLLLNIFFLIIGMFLHSAAAIILTVPIVLPLIHQVGIDPCISAWC